MGKVWVVYKHTFGNGRPESNWPSYIAWKRQWYEKNRDKCLQQMKAYNETHKEEIREYKKLYFQRTYLKKGRHGIKNGYYYKVKQYDLETGELLGEYNSVYEAAEDNYIDHKTIRNAVKKYNGISKKYKWRFELTLMKGGEVVNERV